MSARSFVLLVVLAAICAEFPLTSAFTWVKDLAREKIQTYPNEKELTLRWDWNLAGKEKISQVEITRYKTNNKVNTEKRIGFISWEDNPTADKAFFTLNTELGNSGGYMELIIKDVNKQGYNAAPDKSEVDATEFNYTYECNADITTGIKISPSTIKSIVYEKPTITTPPKSQYVSNSKDNIVLECRARGNLKPKISWNFITTSGKIASLAGEKLDLNRNGYSTNNAGIYNCTATNNLGSASASAVVQYTECNVGCIIDKEIAIEMTQLKYIDYESESSPKYKKLKDDIEEECFNQYIKSSTHKVYSCIVTSFREGSVVANIQITYPSGTKEPRKPLQTAIENGTFAGQRVKTSFVSPTSPPTQPTQPTDKSTDKPSDSPDSGKRANDDGLSDGAIIAIVVVFSIIFIVIIVVLIVCMLKRRKPAGSPSKPYQEDGKGRTAASAPLKSQPYKDPLYDNEPDKPKDVVYADLNFQDRHTNGGGPPPQYTPSSNYAEVRPSQAEQNESGVEWDKSVRDEMWI